MVNILVRASVITGCLLMLAADPVLAQSGWSLAGDLSGGSGRGWGGEYRHRKLRTIRLAISLRGSSAPRRSAYAELAFNSVPPMTGSHTDCLPGIRYYCVRNYPSMSGFELTSGFMARLAPRLELRTGVGGGRYWTEDGWMLGALGQFDISAYPIRHVGIVAGMRTIIVPRHQGERLFAIPWTVGIRVR